MMNRYTQCTYVVSDENRNILPEKMFFRSKFISSRASGQDLFFSKKLMPLINFLSQVYQIIDKKSLKQRRICHGIPKMFAVGCFVINKNCDRLIYATGTSFTSINEAVLRCLGEAVERYCFSNVFITGTMLRRSKVGTYEEMVVSKKTDLPIQEYDIYSSQHKKNFPFLGHKPLAEYTWVPSREVTTNQIRYIPAQLISDKFIGRRQESVVLQHTNSNGYALHKSSRECDMACILEVIERDAFLLFWYAELSAQKIEFDAVDIELASRIQEARHMGLSVEFYAIETGMLLPSIMCIVGCNDGAVSWRSVGASCGFDLLSTLDKALGEAQVISRVILSSNKSIPLHLFSEEQILKYIKFMDRAVLSTNSVIIEKLDSLCTKSKPIKLSELSNIYSHVPLDVSGRYAALIKPLQQAKQKVYVYKYRLFWLWLLGVHVHKVAIPGLLNINLHESFCPSDSSRIKQYCTGKMNALPHPFL